MTAQVADNGDYRLTTAEILYQTPGRPHLIQSFVWQDYDVAPEFPELTRFLKFWSCQFDVTLHSVSYASQDKPSPSKAHYVGYSLEVH